MIPVCLFRHELRMEQTFLVAESLAQRVNRKRLDKVDAPSGADSLVSEVRLVLVHALREGEQRV